MDKLAELISKCKGPVYVDVNGHRGFYETVEQKWRNLCVLDEDLEKETPRDVVDKMIEADTIIEVHFYPETPVGFFHVFHWDLDQALTLALECLK